MNEKVEFETDTNNGKVKVTVTIDGKTKTADATENSKTGVADTLKQDLLLEG